MCIRSRACRSHRKPHQKKLRSGSLMRIVPPGRQPSRGRARAAPSVRAAGSRAWPSLGRPSP
eukprot:4485359-Pyramimonas_sp.AAC.1